MDQWQLLFEEYLLDQTSLYPEFTRECNRQMKKGTCGNFYKVSMS